MAHHAKTCVWAVDYAINLNMSGNGLTTPDLGSTRPPQWRKQAVLQVHPTILQVLDWSSPANWESNYKMGGAAIRAFRKHRKTKSVAENFDNLE